MHTLTAQALCQVPRGAAPPLNETLISVDNCRVADHYLGSVSSPSSSSVESNQEASDDDRVNGRDEEATPNLGYRASAGPIGEVLYNTSAPAQLVGICRKLPG